MHQPANSTTLRAPNKRGSTGAVTIRNPNRNSSIKARDLTNNINNSWKDESKRRQFLEQIGKDMDIDSLDQWSTIRAVDVYKKGGRFLLDQYYRGKPKLYPTIEPD